MGKPNLKDLMNSAQAGLSKHSPIILTSVGIAGMIGTTIMAVKATPKAVQLIEDRKIELGYVDKLPPIDMLKTTWKCYLPAAITGVTSVACILKGNSINTRRNAALLTAYNLSSTALSEYKEKVVETLGEKKEKAIVDAIAKDKIEKNPIVNNEVVVTERGSTLCYDAVFGRYFMSDIDSIMEAEIELNRRIITNMYASLNEFYDEIGLPPVDMGEELGWNIDDGKIKIVRSPAMASDNRPCIAIHYNVAPKRDYYKMF